MLAPQPFCSVKSELFSTRFPLLGHGGGALSLRWTPPHTHTHTTQALYKYQNPRVSKRERKRVMSGRGDLLPAEGSVWRGRLCFFRVPDLQGRPSVARVLAPSSPRKFPAWLLPTREASEASDGCHDRKCPPAQPTQTAPPFPAAPSPRARPAGPGSPDSRGRCNRLGRPISRPLSLALAAAPPHLGTANPKRIQKKPGIPLPGSDHPLSVSSAKHPCTPNAPYPGETAPHHRHGRKSQDIPWGLQWRFNLPGGRCPATQ